MNTTKTSLVLEALEVRENPHVTVDPAAGVLTVTSSPASDRCWVVETPNGGIQVEVYYNGQWNEQANEQFGITKIVYEGNGGNDEFTNGTGIRLQADGGDGYDTIQGGYGMDVIHGGPGNDRLDGGLGNDWLYGEGDKDFLSDTIPVDGKEFLFERSGTNFMFGGAGDDKLYGGDENDVMYGEAGKDILHGMQGNDLLYGGQDGAADELWGDGGADKFAPEYYTAPFLTPDWKAIQLTLNRDAPQDFHKFDGDMVI